MSKIEGVYVHDFVVAVELQSIYAFYDRKTGAEDFFKAGREFRPDLFPYPCYTVRNKANMNPNYEARIKKTTI